MGFVLALNDPAAYEDQYGATLGVQGDMDDDGDQDFDDTDEFAGLLLGGAASGLSEARQALAEPVAPAARASPVKHQVLLGQVISRTQSRNATKTREPSDDELAALWSADLDWLRHGAGTACKQANIE
jgi:hypothetical protein